MDQAQSDDASSAASFTDYRIGAEIGKGSFAVVYKGEYVPTRTAVAIKSVIRNQLTKKLQENLETEISILKSVKHAHIVSLLDCKATKSHFQLIMEYCSLGDLSYFIRNNKEIARSLPLVASLFERFPTPRASGLHEDLTVHFLQQLASALSFLRDHNLVHRDIKPQNLLLSPPAKSQADADALGMVGSWELPSLKLADFGFARILPAASMAETLCGSPLYMAPEILRYEKYNAKADLWSVGAVLYEMAVGTPPFRANNQVELLSKIEKAQDRISFPEANTSSNDVRRLIRGLLKKSPTQRMGFAEFFANPLLSRNTDTEHKPLDQSNFNERMYISEYVQRNAHLSASKNSQYNSPSPSESFLVNTAKATTASSPRDLSPNANASDKDSQALTVAKGSSAGHHVNLPRESPLADGSAMVDKQMRKLWIDAGKAPSANIGDGISRASKSPKSVDRSSPSFAQLIQASTNSNVQGSISAGSSEYVVVEKRTVEVNALADELAHRRPQDSTMPSPTSSHRPSVVYGTSPSNALSRALNMCSERLFGTRIDRVGMGVGPVATPPPQFSQRALLSSLDVDERRLMGGIEDLATKARVVSLFAEVKYHQLPEEPSEPSAPVVAAEALALYVKTLALLARAMDNAAVWWKARSGDSQSTVSPRLSELVQWIRERFNESLERADFAQRQVDSAIQSGEIDPDLKYHITAEKLLFDRALEMSRDAAVNELNGDDLESCELSYGTAIWMLKALLESGSTNGNNGGESLNTEERQVVDKFIVSIGHRLTMLRQKLERNSIAKS